DRVLHVLDRLPVPLIVERREVMGGGLPLRGDVRMAPLVAAGLRLEEEVRTYQAARGGPVGRREEGAAPSVPLLVGSRGREARVEPASAARLESPFAALVAPPSAVPIATAFPGGVLLTLLTGAVPPATLVASRIEPASPNDIQSQRTRAATRQPARRKPSPT